jgi:hypothetical protein
MRLRPFAFLALASTGSTAAAAVNYEYRFFGVMTGSLQPIEVRLLDVSPVDADPSPALGSYPVGRAEYYHDGYLLVGTLPTLTGSLRITNGVSDNFEYATPVPNNGTAFSVNVRWPGHVLSSDALPEQVPIDAAISATTNAQSGDVLFWGTISSVQVTVPEPAGAFVAPAAALLLSGRRRGKRRAAGAS